MEASLVMRDRETDSWWSIMTSTAIGGPMEGAELRELPLGEKTTWKRWKERHPDTLVLSVNGREHERLNPYRPYFGSDETFRDLKIKDRRLKPKEPIYSFWWSDTPYAVAHQSFEGGKIFAPKGLGGRGLLLYRPRGASMFESTKAFVIDGETASGGEQPEALLAQIESGDAAAERLPGFDTFWYSWVSINKDSLLLR